MRHNKVLLLAQSLKLPKCGSELRMCGALQGGVSAVGNLNSTQPLSDSKDLPSRAIKFCGLKSFDRSGVTWTLPVSKHQDDVAGAAKISSNDFVYQETFKEGPFMTYKDGRLSSLYQHDPRQEIVILKLQDMYQRLRKVFRKHKSRSGLTLVDNLNDNSAPTAWWTGISNMMNSGPTFNPGSRKGLSKSSSAPGSRSVQGLYMYGGVGVGKTMLMDLFVYSSPPEFRVHRTHFHTFMLDIHSRLKDHTDTQDPLVGVADDISQGCRVLALDEFFVTDVADAMILHRLFDRLWENGIVLIATSNREPDGLYEGGLQRDLFLPFIDKLKEACDIHNMESTTDYRKLAQHQQGLYFEDSERLRKLRDVFHNMTGHDVVTNDVPIEVQFGRTIWVPEAAGKVCYYTFDQLCGQPLGPADYIALVHNFHTVCVEDIPQITAVKVPEAYRLVMLIDVLYDHRIRLACSASAPPVDLFEKIVTQAALPPGGISERASDLVVDDNLGFAKDRTIGRLTEMQSMTYLVDHANRHAPELLLALAEAQANPKHKDTSQLSGVG